MTSTTSRRSRNLDGIRQMLATSLRRDASIEQKVELLRIMRRDSAEAGKEVDEFLVGEVARLRGAVDELSSTHKELREVMSKLTAPPFHLATYLGDAGEAGGVRSAVVSYGSGRRAVSLGEGVETTDLKVGDDVFLGSDLNVLLGRAPQHRSGGEIGTFKRFSGRDQMVLESRDEEIVVLAAETVLRSPPDPGDLILWDRSQWLAFTRIGKPDGRNLLLEDTPTESFADIGGLDEVIEKTKRSIRLRFEYPELADRYGLHQTGGILLAGPPGNGKTMLARALANWLAELSGSGRSSFMAINPGELHSMWYSKAEENYREAFRVAREAGDAHPNVPVVIFFDELDSCGSIRGDTATGTGDRVLSALLAELDGFAGRGNVVVIGATNRLGSIDPALVRPGRFGDCILEVPLPDRSGARQIISKHLKPNLPLAPLAGMDTEMNSPRADGVRRDEMIEGLLSLVYSANGIGEVASLMMRDGSTCAIEPRDLFSGADLAKVVHEASETACRREVRGGGQGVRLEDLAAAAERGIEQKLLSLTPQNCSHHLPRLSNDAEVVAIKPRERRVQKQHRRLRAC